MIKWGFVALLAALVGTGCSSKTRAMSAEPSGLKIGDHCVAEDGWPSKSSSVAAVDEVRLPPGVPYCVTRLPYRPHGFFTSNCMHDSDCPGYSRCDGQTWCNVPCSKDSDCESGLFCPAGEGTRFCRPACPAEQPVEDWGCSSDSYVGPQLCSYKQDASSSVTCTCSNRGQNTFAWTCTVPKGGSQCPTVAPTTGAACTSPDPHVTCSWPTTSSSGGATCRCAPDSSTPGRSSWDCGASDASVDSTSRCPASAPAPGDTCGGIASPVYFVGSTCSWANVDGGTLTCKCVSDPVVPNNSIWDCGPAHAAGSTVDAQGDVAASKTFCRETADCVLVHWGCCEDQCEYPNFTVAVNKAAESSVVRVAPFCGQVCGPKNQCAFQLSAACESDSCVVKCAGACPVAPTGDGAPAMPVSGTATPR